MGCHPGQGALFCFRSDGADGAERDVLTGGRSQTGLNPPHTGVTLDQQGQDLTLEGRRDGGSSRQRKEGGFHGLPAALHPGIERLTRNSQVAAEVRDDAIVASMGDHLADGLGTLRGRAIMALNHCVPLKGW